MADLARLDADQLKQLARQSAAIVASCICDNSVFAGWGSLPLSLPENQLEDIGTLLQDAYVEPSFVEYHPDGSRYESPTAPVAVHYFPYNRCNVARCTLCGRHYLRYVEAGGYFVDRRIRALLDATLVSDAPLAA
ncbi:hypothetical protein PQR62_09590 [Herbaspirillum lusitanum]|uniref:Uncharacterized protein n=1 Tax=Herbaspirillum lusitanum TaxID=213312 RepID=A0ABW9A723_9BURK